MKKSSLFAAILLYAVFFNPLYAMDVTTAIEKASKDGQFLMLTFYEKSDPAFKEMSDVIKKFIKSKKNKVNFYNAKISKKPNQELADKYGVLKSHLPIVLVLAPNGAITGGFPNKVTTEKLKQCTSVSDLVLKTLKPLQEQKIVLVALQNKSTKFNAQSLKGVKDFASDPQYSKFTDVVVADPAALGSADFIKQSRLISPLTEATVVVLLPPGQIGKVLTGKLTKADVLGALQSCTSGGCGSGCSDQRYKKDINPIKSALDKVSKLNGVSFTWNRDKFPRKFFPEGRNIGFIAQNVEKFLPEVVNTDNEGYKSVEYDKITALLVEALKELELKIKKQNVIIAEQEKRIKVLELKK